MRPRHLPVRYLLGVDAVEKLSDDQRAGNNRIQIPGPLNQCCAPDSYQSMLLNCSSKNIFRQHLPLADMHPFGNDPSHWLLASSRKCPRPRMPIDFNHTIVWARDGQVSSKFLAEVLGLSAPGGGGRS